VKRLYRSRENKMLAGILGGLGEYLGVDPTVVRVGYFVLMFLTAIFPLVLLYFVLYLIVPEQEIF
jgi:phage shock protein C